MTSTFTHIAAVVAGLAIFVRFHCQSARPAKGPDPCSRAWGRCGAPHHGSPQPRLTNYREPQSAASLPSPSQANALAIDPRALI